MRLNRRLNARLNAWLTFRTDGRPFRPPNPLREICQLLNCYVRLRKRAARRDPHLCGPHAQRYYADTLKMERDQVVIEAALDRVYGPAPAGESPPARDIWRERYDIQLREERRFRKWFREQYGQ